MVSKKQIKLILSGLILVFSVLAIFLSDESSKLIAPFEEETRPELEDLRDQSPLTLDVYEEEVLGQSLLPSGAPALSFVPEETTEEGPIDQENDQVDEDGYKVVKVVDGDTLDVEIDRKIERLRLIGIDTPETVDPRKSVGCFGREASDKAKELLEGKSVALESDDTQGDRDKYKRLLRYVFLPDQTNFNLYMIEEGYAHEYTYQDPYKYQFDFKEAQRKAMENEKGLWSPSTCSGNK